jgi:hypothetical protein
MSGANAAVPRRTTLNPLLLFFAMTYPYASRRRPG